MAKLLRIVGEEPLPPELKGGVVAIGNFDGVHRGHQAVLQGALARARASRLPALVLTFDPHPRLVFRPDTPMFILTPPPMRAVLLDQLGFDAVVEQPFTQHFAAQSAEDFVAGILRERLGIAHAVTGFDFHFGRNREGGPAFLMASGERDGFDVTPIDAFRDEAAEIVSSSRIRVLLSQGDAAQAAGLLGYRYTVEAEVAGGQRLGRTLGFPTANMKLSADNLLAHGIYAVRLRRPDGTLHDGVASHGRRPTVDDDGMPLLETFLFDFDDSLYGQSCRVSFFGFLRGEVKFDGLDALVAQMRRDAEEARALLARVTPLSRLDAGISF